MIFSVFSDEHFMKEALRQVEAARLQAKCRWVLWWFAVIAL